MADFDPLSLDFATRHPDSFARTISRAEPPEVAKLIAKLPESLRAGIIARLPGSHIEHLTAAAENRPAEWLAAAPFDDALSLLSRLPQEQRLDYINAVGNRERRQQLLRSQRYPAHSVGSLVGDLPIRISIEASAVHVLAELRRLDSDDPGPLVVVDDAGRYLGIIDRWRLLIGNPPAGLIKDYTISLAALLPETSVAAAAAMPEWHTRNWLPVVDHRRRVLGAVSRDKLFAAAAEHGDATRRSGNALLGLLTDVVYVLDGVLERILAPRHTQ